MNATGWHLHHVEDQEGDGVCAHCGRTGLRWIAVLVNDDGETIQVGTACAQRALGIPTPRPATLTWMAGAVLVASKTVGNSGWTLWRRGKRSGAVAQNGSAVAFGPMDWCDEWFAKATA